MTTLHEILTAAEALPAADRLELALKIQQTLDRPGEELTQQQWDEAWVPELRRRLEESERGETAVPLEEAWQRIAGKYG